MSEIREHVAYLSQTIGPRPAGTEEEQQAALYITEKLQQEAGLPAVIEDFNCNPDYDLPRALCCGVTAIIAVVAMFIPVMTIPALIVTLLCAVVFALESFGKPVISRFLNRGVSQNVVAKYEPPAAAGGSRRRKIVLVAHYDSGKVNKENSGFLFKILTQLRWAVLGGMVVVPVLFLIRTLIAFGGVGLIVMNVLTGIALVCALTPLIMMALHRGAAYNESANCNAAGVAVLMDVAERVSRSAEEGFDAAAAEGDAVMHGEQAAIEAGLVPETGEFVYEAAAVEEEVEESPAARLAAAKAAIAALTGQPVSTTINIDFAEEPSYAPADEEPAFPGEFEEDRPLASSDSFVEGIAADVAANAAAAAVGGAVELAAEAAALEPAAEAVAEVVEEISSVPAWFKAAQAKAKKPAEEAPVQRSRYAEAFDAFERENSNRAEEASAFELSETEKRLQEMRERIMESTAPNFSRAAEARAAEPAAVELAVAEPLEAQPASAPVATEPEPVATPAAAVAPVAVPAAAPAPEPAPVVAPVAKSQVKPQVPVVAPVADLGATTAFTPVPINPAELAAEASAIDPVPAARKQPTPRPRRAISLPSIGGFGEAEPAVESAAATATPTSRTGRVRSLRSVLPSIGVTDQVVPAPQSEQPAPEAEEVDPFAPKPIEAFQEEQFEPVVEQPTADPALEGFAEEAYEEGYYEEEECYEEEPFASLYVEMPKSRRERFMEKFRFGRKKKQEPIVQSTPQEWLDVDDEFDARTAGKARGSWESFRQEEPVAEDAYYAEDGYGYDYGYGYDDGYGSGDGYAYGNDAYPADSYGADDAYDLGATTQFQPVDSWGEDDYEEPAPKRSRRGGKRRWQGGSFSGEQLGRVSTILDDLDAYEAYEEEAYEAQDQIEAFHSQAINTEVWFVALGSELAANGGMSAFVAEHAKDLKGAIIIELDALGAGELSLIEKEGLYRPKSISSRMKRYARKAASELGMSIGSGSILWKDGPAAYALKHGFQAMHIAGMAEGKPALYGQANDMMENISEETLQMNSDYVMELIKQI